MAIKSFRNRETWRLFERDRIEDLKVPPGNRLEKLSGDRAGQYSIRINQRYRVCFIWKDGDATEVEVTDYH